MNLTAASDQKVLRRQWSRSGAAIAYVLLFLAAGRTAYATSQCLQWRIGNGQPPGTATTDWMPSAPQACSAYVGLCAANPTSCGYNPVNFDYRNWSGNAVLSSAGWPGFYCNFTTQVKNKIPGQFPTDWTDHPDYKVIGFGQDPVGCKVYVSALALARALCGPARSCVGHPINPASGAVYDTITDVPSISGSPAFHHFYNSTDSGSPDLSAGWRHSFSRNIQPKYGSTDYRPYVQTQDTSSLYTDEATACISGFAEIKARSSTWANATASYANGVCSLNTGSTRIGTLTLLYTSTPTPDPSTLTLVGYDATRDDGQLVSFSVQGGSIVAPPSIGLKLQQTSSGYTLTDGSDNVETYDANGKLLSVTSPAGVVQTMTYDSSGRLGTVTDSFGHRLSLSYDGQGRLSSVARP
jgi:YD repeat-containing protein